MNDGVNGLLFIVFMTLKLCDKIDWSWWWVTAPLWWPFGVIAVVVAVYAVALLLTAWVEWIRQPKRKKVQP